MRLAIFFLDAIRFRDIGDETTPFLARLCEEGMGGPLDTLLAYEGLAATIFTGTYPSRHGIWTRYFANPTRSPFKWVGPLAPLSEMMNRLGFRAPDKLLRYGIMRLSNAFAGISYFPGIDSVPLKQLSQMDVSLRHNLFEPGCFGDLPSLFDMLRERNLAFRFFDHGLLDSDLSVIQKALAEDLSSIVTVVRLIDLDTISHRYGLESEERASCLKRTDRLVEKTILEWRKKIPRLAVLCFADHGMIPVDRYVDFRRIFQEAGIVPFRDFGMFLDSTMARFWGEDEITRKIQDVLSRMDCGRVLSQTDIQRFHLPQSRSWGSLIFLLKPGWAIYPSFFDGEEHVKAMHGYDPTTPGLETFIAIDSSNGYSHRLSRASMIDILPTALDLLGLQSPGHCHGSSLLRA